MKHAIALSALVLSASAWAAEPKTNFLDHSTESLMDAATAKAIMNEGIPAKVWKLYPAKQYTFLSQVEGGMTSAGTCVVTARVIQLTLTPTVKAPLFRPQKTATTFDAIPNANGDQCKELAKAKLKEATAAVVSSLVKT